MTDLQPYRPAHLPGLAEVWNASLAGGPNFIRVGEADLRLRVMTQPSFDPADLLVALHRSEVVGFVHMGFRSNLWLRLPMRRLDHTEGHIYALVAASSEPLVAEALLEEAEKRLSGGGARHVLLHPSWVHGTQPFYNGIAGAYETPGLAAGRREIAEMAAARGFLPVAEYGTPELDLLDQGHLAALRSEGARLWEMAQAGGLERDVQEVEPGFFPGRRAVTLARGRETVATTAYGLWEEYARQYGRRLFGVTGVHVVSGWRGRGLGKLIMILALEAALAEGASGLHLHVCRQNGPAWSLYHRALGFRPRFTWLTLGKRTD